MKTINIRGSIMDLSEPKVMGIINVTDDSFHAASRKTEIAAILQTAEEMLHEGATFLDIGGYSSRPGATDIDEEVEKARVLTAVKAIRSELPEAIISVDSFRSSVARAAVHEGADIINDISAGHLDPAMHETVAELGVPYIGMHMRGNPQTMTGQSNYDDLINELNLYFSEVIASLRRIGVNDIILDPGFGFAKTIAQNFELMKDLSLLQIHERPLLIGISRKSMIYKTLNLKTEQALNGTTVLNTVALLKGASILRVHDVREAVEAVQLVRFLGN